MKFDTDYNDPVDPDAKVAWYETLAEILAFFNGGKATSAECVPIIEHRAETFTTTFACRSNAVAFCEGNHKGKEIAAALRTPPAYPVFQYLFIDHDANGQAILFSGHVLSGGAPSA